MLLLWWLSISICPLSFNPVRILSFLCPILSKKSSYFGRKMCDFWMGGPLGDSSRVHVLLFTQPLVIQASGGLVKGHNGIICHFLFHISYTLDFFHGEWWTLSYENPTTNGHVYLFAATADQLKAKAHEGTWDFGGNEGVKGVARWVEQDLEMI